MENNTMNNLVLQSTELNYKGKFLIHTTKKYISKDDPNKNFQWECCCRNFATNKKRISGVEIIPLVVNEKGGNSIIIIENYRFPVEKRVLEFPAGIIDDHEVENTLTDDTNFQEILIQAAKRELKEETGYVGQFKSFYTLPGVNPVKTFENVFYDAWKSEENGASLVFVIDKTSSENQVPQQNLEFEENIKIYEVELSSLADFISDKINNENYGCSSNLYAFCMGLRMKEVLGNFI